VGQQWPVGPNKRLPHVTFTSFAFTLLGHAWYSTIAFMPA